MCPTECFKRCRLRLKSCSEWLACYWFARGEATPYVMHSERCQGIPLCHQDAGAYHLGSTFASFCRLPVAKMASLYVGGKQLSITLVEVHIHCRRSCTDLAMRFVALGSSPESLIMIRDGVYGSERRDEIELYCCHADDCL